MPQRSLPILTPYPRGWYLAAHSDELAPKEVKSLQLFGEDVVLFRDANGEAHLVDAYCPHLGAHLGHGGVVVGERIRCPFHGWEYEGRSGMCQRLANGDPVPPKARLRRWPIAEVDGMILVWFHETGEAPSWEFGGFPEHRDSGWSEWSHQTWRLRARIQDVAENDADVSHSPVMHGFTDDIPALELTTEGPRLHWLMRARLNLGAFGVPRIPGLPDRVPSEISVTRWGMSLGWVRNYLFFPREFQFRTQTLATTTPIDADHVQLTVRHRIRKMPAITKLVLRNYARLFNRTVEQDIVIWENKIYRPRPVASRSDWAILKFRQWSRQFYEPKMYEQTLDRAGATTDEATG